MAPHPPPRLSATEPRINQSLVTSSATSPNCRRRRLEALELFHPSTATERPPRQAMPEPRHLGSQTPHIVGAGVKRLPHCSSTSALSPDISPIRPHVPGLLRAAAPLREHFRLRRGQGAPEKMHAQRFSIPLCSTFSAPLREPPPLLVRMKDAALGIQSPPTPHPHHHGSATR